MDLKRDVEFFKNFLALLENAIDRRASFATGGLAEKFEDLDQALHLAFGFLEMSFECRLELG